MSHLALGNISGEFYNTTKDKVITLTEPMKAGSVVAVFSGGYGPSPTTLDGMTDSKGNSYTSKFRSSLSGNCFSLVSWSRLDVALTTLDTVTINLGGGFTRSYAVLRGYEGLGGTAFDTDDGGSEGTSSFPAITAGSLSHTAAGRALSIVTYPTEYFSSNLWQNGFAQTENYFDSTNVDVFDIGEQVLAGSGTVTPKHNIGVNSQWVIVGVSLPEQAMPSARRNRVVLVT